MDYKTIKVERDGNVGILTLNRPERLNAINQSMLDEIQSACDAFESEDAIRCVVLTGEGKAFSSGFDLQDQAANTPQGHSEWQPVLRRDFDGVMRFWNMSKPTVSAVRGPAMAGGCEMAMACDITVAGEGAVFGEPEVKFGAGIVVMLLPWLAGPKKAKEIAFLGMDTLSAQAALDAGLVNRVVSDDDVFDTAMSIARHISVVDPMVIRRTKQQINETMEMAGMRRALERALEIDLELEAEGSFDKRDFLEQLRENGVRGALAWRDDRFAK
ncbi:enoyl-CoA hydratase/isomerase family protein [Roseovarius sp. D22-M7]|uniref:enoyl-CoA hydratase/isomerase family protein n=1 Tax=Roseovarius sp. D22-M7 TaxID=3127116 RepID=UPI00300FD074